jgi:hypothetical protein
LKLRCDFNGDVATVGFCAPDRAARSFCNRASYPGEVVTVGGAAPTGDAEITDTNVVAAATTA